MKKGAYVGAGASRGSDKGPPEALSWIFVLGSYELRPKCVGEAEGSGTSKMDMMGPYLQFNEKWS